MKEGRDRPDRHTLNPHSMPLRSTGRSALLLLIASPLLLSAAPQDLRDFDDFIRHVRMEAGSGHPERIADCFAPLIVAEDGCDPVPFGDAFGYDAQRFGWAQVGRDIARFADGFALVNADGTMVNLHARAAGRAHYLDILGDRVKLRREAGSTGAIIAMLDEGTLPGHIDETRWTLTRDGVRWTPVVAIVPGMGKVRGYVGEDYVKQSDSQGDLKLTAKYDGQRWALTSYERTRPELAVKDGVPTP